MNKPTSTALDRALALRRKLKGSLERLRKVDRLLAGQLKRENRKKLTHARNMQEMVVKLRRKALNAQPKA